MTITDRVHSHPGAFRSSDSAPSAGGHTPTKILQGGQRLTRCGITFFEPWCRLAAAWGWDQLRYPWLAGGAGLKENNFKQAPAGQQAENRPALGYAWQGQWDMHGRNRWHFIPGGEHPPRSALPVSSSLPHTILGKISKHPSAAGPKTARRGCQKAKGIRERNVGCARITLAQKSKLN